MTDQPFSYFFVTSRRIRTNLAMRYRFLAFVAVLAALLASCHKLRLPDKTVVDIPEVTPRADSLPPGEYSLSLIQTTDIHGYMVFTDESAVHYRLAYIADKVEDIRRKGEGRLLLLDGGDLYQGASISNLMEGWPVYVSLDKMGYDAVTVGNHEFDWGIDKMVEEDATLPDYEWEGKRCANKVPVVCANLFRDGSRVSSTRDYVIVEKSAFNTAGEAIPVRIGIIGFAVNYAGSIMSTQFAGKGYSIKEDYSIANDIAAALESSGVCDATILLIHGEADDAAEKLGRGTDIDLVLGGHSHRTLSGWTSGWLPYLQGGRHCEHYACADLTFKVDEEGKLSFKGVENLQNPEVDPLRDQHAYPGQNAGDLSETILAVSDYALEATAKAQGEVLGYIDVDATTYPISSSGGRSSVVANWMCDILRRIGEADVSFVNSGGVRMSFPLNGGKTRDITAANIYELFPFSNTTYVYRLTYAELLRVFEYSMTSGGESLFTYMTGLDCYYSRTDYATYSTYSVYSLRKDGTVIYQKGKWTGDWASRTVTLAVSEYLATTERTDYYTNLVNPLVGWNKTSRLVGSSLVDNENAVRVLKDEAAASGGRLAIDTAPHFILSY